MLKQMLQSQLDRPAEKSDPFAGVSLLPRQLNDRNSGPGHIPPEELLKHLVDTIRNRVLPWEDNIKELFDFLKERSSDDASSAAARLALDGGLIYRDPVHGTKLLPPWLVDLIDTAPMIRLAGVNQMTVGLTARGAGVYHTRLTHSIGVAILALEMSEKLGFDAHETKLVTALAIFHDARHGPFSHIYDHVHIAGIKFDHDERSIDFLRAPDVAAALDRIGLTPEEIARHLKASSVVAKSFDHLSEHERREKLEELKTKSSPYGYLAKVILDRVDYAQRDPAKSNVFKGGMLASIRETSRELLESLQYDRERGLITIPSNRVDVLRDFVELRGSIFTEMPFDKRTQVCNAFIRRELHRTQRLLPARRVEDVFLESSTYMTDDELLEYFSDRGRRLLRSGELENHLATLVVIRAEDLTEKGREELRVPQMHEHLPFICGGKFYRDFDPLVIRVPSVPPSMTFYIDDGRSVFPREMLPSSADDELPEWNKSASSRAPVPRDFGIREIRICSYLGDEAELTVGQGRIKKWLDDMGYTRPDAKVVADLDDLQR